MKEQCTMAWSLGPAEMGARLAGILELTGRRPRSVQPVTLLHHPSGRSAIMEMIRREEECCAFLKIMVDDTTSSITVVIEAPDETAAPLLDAFSLRPSAAKFACACCAEVAA